MTNLEKITAPLQTAQGLAAFLMEMDDNWCVHCGNQAQGNLSLDDDINPTDAFCIENIAKWLESDAKE